MALSLKETLLTVGTYALLMALALFACCAAAAVLKFILKFVFKQVRFFVCLLLALALLGSFLIKSAIDPVRQSLESSGVSEIMDSAVDQFKGLYSKTLPLLAWRFTDITEETAAQEDYFEDDESENTDNAEDENTVRIRIDYLPVGSVVLAYDKADGTFSVEKPLDEN